MNRFEVKVELGVKNRAVVCRALPCCVAVSSIETLQKGFRVQGFRGKVQDCD